MAEDDSSLTIQGEPRELLSSRRISTVIGLVIALGLWACAGSDGGNSAGSEQPGTNVPIIETFYSSPSLIPPGDTSMLVWSVSGATRVTLDPGGTDVTNMTSRGVAPGISTQYTLTASNAGGSVSARTTVTVQPAGTTVRILFLHHSTGGLVWDAGVPQTLAAYNNSHGTQYLITEQSYPNSPYPWNNYPYDYWNLWVAHTGTSTDMDQANLDMLAIGYDIIVFKHCFPVCEIGPDNGPASVSSPVMSLQNYYLQYNALKARMREFPATRFIVWTGAALREADTTVDQATRAKTFFDWVKMTWDEEGDNIFIWDFYYLETEGGMYLTVENASGDSHPNFAFCDRVAPLFVNRLVDVIEGRGDTGSLTGE